MTKPNLLSVREISNLTPHALRVFRFKEKLTLKEIGKRCGLSSTTVSERMREYHIKTKKLCKSRVRYEADRYFRESQRKRYNFKTKP